METKKNQLFALLIFVLSFFLTVDSSAFSLGSIAGATGGGGSFMTVLNLFGLGDAGYCWFCPLYENLFNAMNQLTTTVAQSLADMFLATLGIGIAFYILFKVIMLMVKTQEVSLAQFLEDMIKRLGRAMIAAVFIASALPFFYHVLSPFLEYTFNLSVVLMDASPSSGGAVMEAGQSLLNLISKDICTSARESVIISDESSISMAFTDNVLQSMLCMLDKISASLVLGMVVGGTIMMLAGSDLVMGIFPNGSLLLTGMVFFGTYFIIYLSVPFKMIDALIRLSFVCALTPLWIILWVFPITASYTRNAWEMFLNCCVTFICMSIMLILIFQLLESALPNISDIIPLMIMDRVAAASKELSLLSPSSLLTASIGMICYQMVGAASIIAQNIVKSYDAGVGRGMEQTVIRSISATAAGATGAAAGITAMAAGAGMAASGGAEGITQMVKEKVDDYRNKSNPENQQDNSQKPTETKSYTEEKPAGK